MAHHLEINVKKLVLAVASVTILVLAPGRISPHVPGNTSETATQIAHLKATDAGPLASVDPQQRPGPDPRSRESDQRRRDSGQRSREPQERTGVPECRTDPQSPTCLEMRINELTGLVESLQQTVEYLRLHELSGVVESLQQRVENLSRTQASGTPLPADVETRLKTNEFNIKLLQKAIGKQVISDESEEESAARAESADDLWAAINQLKQRVKRLDQQINH